MSIQNSLFKVMMKLLNGRKISARAIEKPSRKTKTLSAEKFKGINSVKISAIDGHEIVTLVPQMESKKHIIFLHGGAYVLEALDAHRKIAETLCEKWNYHVSVIDYPLAPENTVDATHKLLINAYKEITKKYRDHTFCVFGDSAGGGLALAFLQSLKANLDLPFPVKTALVSPWLDATLNNKDIDQYHRKDLILSKKALIHAAKQYAGGKELSNPKISPLLGDLSELKEILMLSGTDEIMYPDCRRLNEIVKGQIGTKLKFIEFSGLLHDWILFPIPEAKKAIDLIGNWFKND